MSYLDPEVQNYRKLMFEPCKTREHLKNWIHFFLKIDLPDCTVDNESTSNPVELIWECYSKMMEGTDEDFTHVLAYASRDSFKTLSASILEFLCIVHLSRDVAHVAAILQQSKKAQEYIKRYFGLPGFKDFLVIENERNAEFAWYTSKRSGAILTPDEFKTVAPQEQHFFENNTRKIQLLVATKESMNSAHVPFYCLDELDLAKPGAIEEGKMIPAPTYDGKLPLTFMTSTRKYSFGLVQKEIDKAYSDSDYKLQQRHWNIIDVTKACPPERHLPEEPNIYIYYSREDLKSINEETFKALNPEEQKKYQKAVGYQGCLQNCKLFSVCRGRLAKHQKSKSPLLRSIQHVTNQFKSLNPEMAKAQLMCWKPASTGLIYPRLERDTHLKTADEMYEMITGDKPYKSMTKRDIISLVVQSGGRFYSGLDWGFTHNFAVVTAAKVGNLLFVIDVICISGLELAQKLDICEKHLKPLNPTIFPDPEDPASIKTFQKRGFKCMKFTKNVSEGIEAVRSKLAPSMDAPPELFILKGDDQCELLYRHMSEYHFKVDEADKPTKVPDDENDDLPDAIRYLCQNLVGKRGSIHAAKELLSAGIEEAPANSKATWMTEKIEELTKGASEEELGDGLTQKKGNFHWNI